jgi:AcrR family transcriptional regulator
MININKDEEVKNSILEAAKRVFQKWGLNKTTMEDIAHEAGKGKSTLYYYYKSKDELFETLAMIEFNSCISKANSSVREINSAKEKLKKYIAVMLNGIKKTASIYPLVKGEIKGNKEFLDKIRKVLDAKEELIIADILKLGIESGEFNFLTEQELSKAASVIVSIFRGLILYLFIDNDDIEKIEIATKMITEGI